MSGIYHSALELIGNTPLLELHNLEKKHDLKGRIAAKLESRNPAGSVKDRVALSMILDAEEKGEKPYQPFSGGSTQWLNPAWSK